MYFNTHQHVIYLCHNIKNREIRYELWDMGLDSIEHWRDYEKMVEENEYEEYLEYIEEGIEWIKDDKTS